MAKKLSSKEIRKLKGVARKRNMSRSRKALSIDMKKTSKNLIIPKNSEDFKKWSKNKGRYDLKGVDVKKRFEAPRTFGGKEFSPGRAFSTKKEAKAYAKYDSKRRRRYYRVYPEKIRSQIIGNTNYTIYTRDKE